MIYRSAAFLLLLLLPAFNLACTGYGAPSEVVNGTATITVEGVVGSAGSPPNWPSYRTFTITPTIQVQDNTSGSPSDYTRDASSIIPKIQTNMTSRGYTYIESIRGSHHLRRTSQSLSTLISARKATAGSTATGITGATRTAATQPGDTTGPTTTAPSSCRWGIRRTRRLLRCLRRGRSWPSSGAELSTECSGRSSTTCNAS